MIIDAPQLQIEGAMFIVQDEAEKQAVTRYAHQSRGTLLQINTEDGFHTNGCSFDVAASHIGLSSYARR
jgi:hypothetical protein